MMAHSSNYEFLIDIYKPLLEVTVIASHIAPDLTPWIGGIDAVQRVIIAENNSVNDGVIKLLDLLKETNKPGYLQALLTALEANDYKIIADQMRGEKEIKNTEVFKELLGMFCKNIIDTVDPDNITPFLLQRETISLHDVENIRHATQKEGTMAGMIMLLCRLPNHNNYWFSDFIAALKNVDKMSYKALAKEIEPAIFKACPTKEREMEDTFLELNQQQLKVNDDSMDTDLQTHQSNFGSTVHEYNEYQEDIQSVTLLGASDRPDAEGREHLPDDNEQKTWATGRDHVVRNIPEHITSSGSMDLSLSTEINRTQVKDCLVDRCSPGQTHLKTNDLNNLSMFHSQNKTFKTINLPFDGQSSCQDPADAAQTMSDENQPSASATKREKCQAQPLLLRSYQKELARRALDGKNVIIMAPTGSGKTHVALYITENHLSISGGKMVAMFVPTTELVSQQTQMFKTYLSRYKVHGLTGQIQENQKVPLSSVIDNHHIIVMTPQIMLNALRLKDVQSLRVFTLMIFDECHHTTKEHPYNNIMATYFDEKYNENRDYLLPQIVGLTASVGVGNARDPERAKEHILTLCANLDASGGISVVEEHKEELEKFVNKPNEEKIETLGRVEDPFRKKITGVMCKIEECVKDWMDKNNTVKVSHLMCIPSEKGSDQYIQWISRLHREVAKIYDQHIRRPVYACQAHLRIYNTALMINEDCRTVDALNYLTKEFRDIDPEYKDETDVWLDNLFKNCKDELKCISHNPRYDNPKLKKLADLVLKKYKSDKDLRAIIFCKTREMTMALQKWMEETPELVDLNPYRLVGASASADKGGMTLNKQEDVLRCFKDGKHKVIIATSVAEEGLDVSKCSLVIRYEYVTNEIAMIQARGRARAKDSEYIVMGDHSQGAPQREEMNRIKENMMNKAIEIIKHMSEEERCNEIQKLQNEARSERRMNAVDKILKARSCLEGSSDFWELRCMKCDELGCLASDVRVFAESHHMILDKSFKARIIVEPHPNPKKIDDIMKTDKIFCKKCCHDWGICVIYRGIKICVIKVSSFRVINVNTQAVFTPRKWRDVPFTVARLMPEELEQYCQDSTEEDNSASC